MINDVSVCVNNIERNNNAVAAAASFAERHSARLTGIYIKLDTVEIARWSSFDLMAINKKMLDDQQVKEVNAFALCESLTEGFNCEKTWKTVNQSSDPIKQMLCTDIIFVAQPSDHPQTNYDDNSFINQLILQTKRPVIMIPRDWNKKEFGSKILLGWNKSPEAMRAASDAVSVMQSSKEIEILDILKNSMFHAEPDSAPDIENYLMRKGIKANLEVKGVHIRENEHEILLSHAKDNDINLIVIGAYGHTRLREVVMGGHDESPDQTLASACIVFTLEV